MDELDISSPENKYRGVPVTLWGWSGMRDFLIGAGLKVPASLRSFARKYHLPFSRKMSPDRIPNSVCFDAEQTVVWVRRFSGGVDYDLLMIQRDRDVQEGIREKDPWKGVLDDHNTRMSDGEEKGLFAIVVALVPTRYGEDVARDREGKAMLAKAPIEIPRISHWKSHIERGRLVRYRESLPATAKAVRGRAIEKDPLGRASTLVGALHMRDSKLQWVRIEIGEPGPDDRETPVLVSSRHPHLNVIVDAVEEMYPDAWWVVWSGLVEMDPETGEDLA